jgi:hypothetical protein
MKVLTAAPYLYRGVEVGFCDCEPGELVRLGERDECCCARYEDEEEVEAFVDEVCECHLDMDESPPFLGLVSLAGATTARVEERDLAEAELRAAVRGGLDRGGWLAPGLPEGISRALVDIEIARIHQATSVHPVGTLISSLGGLTFPVDETTARAVTRRRR